MKNIILKLLVINLFFGAGICYGGIINVPADYSTIQGAIDVSISGDVIQVSPGVYNESIIAKDDITIRGLGAGILTPSDVADDVILNGNEMSAYGISISSNTNVSIINLNITNYNNCGISINHGFNIKIYNCNIHHNRQATNGGGIDASTVENLLIENCIIASNRVAHSWDYGSGILIDFGGTFKLKNCLITNNGWCEHGAAYITSDGAVENCTIDNNGCVGMYIRANIIVKNCIISNNTYHCIDSSASTAFLNNNVFNISGRGDRYYNISDQTGINGNISVNPLFVAGPKGGYYLSQTLAGQSSNSACLDAGSDLSVNFGLNAYTTRTDEIVDNGIADIGYHYLKEDAGIPPSIYFIGTQAANENSLLEFTVRASDPDNQYLLLSAQNLPEGAIFNQVLDNPGYAEGVFNWTPNYDQAGEYTGIRFMVNDGGLNNYQDIDIIVRNTNRVPIANAQSATTDEEIAKSITLTGSDPDGDTITYSIVAMPLHGVLNGTPPNVTYTPSTNYNGADSFTFKVYDGYGYSTPGTVTITVRPVNDAPTANSQSVTTNEDSARLITLVGSDIDRDTLTYIVVDNPSHGTLTGTGAGRTYTPAANYNGADSFTFKVNDGTVDSAAATVSITVTAVNDAPTANAQSVTTNEDTASVITLMGSDIEGSTLTYVIVTNPAHGTLSGTAPNVTYTPASNYNGADSFTFKVRDGALDSTPVTVSITVTAVNDAPTANSQLVTTNEDSARNITLTGSDVEGSTIIYAIVALPLHGTISGSAPNIIYTPATNYNGADSFTFKVNDGTVDSAAATVSITVTAVNDAPVANSQSVTTNEDSARNITLIGSDVEGSTIIYTIVALPLHGTISGSAPNIIYTPATNYNGADSFTFKVNDGTVDSAVATVSITVNPVNDAPTANAQSITTNEDTARAITLTGTDVDGDPLTYIIVTNPAHGALSGTVPNVTYTPVANYNGADSFTFKVNDGTVDSASATVTITVTSANDAPVANAQSVTAGEDTAESMTLTGSDIDGDRLTYIIVTHPSHGALSGIAPNVTYTPASNYNGTDSFTFKVNDGTVDSVVATVSITVTAVNDVPTANSQSVTTNEDSARLITLVGSDIDGDTLTYIVVDNPLHGTLTGTGASRTYTPTANYNGADSFTFKVNDGTVDSVAVTVSITVTAINDAPVANNQSVSVNENTATQINISSFDVDGDSLTYRIITRPAHGTLSGTGANIRYTPRLDYIGSDSFTFAANDGTIDSNVATVSITVRNLPPPTPRNLRARVVMRTDGKRDIFLDWDRVTDSRLVGYNVYFLDGIFARKWEKLNTNVVTGNSYTIKRVNSGLFYFMVRSVDDQGLLSDDSNVVRVSVP